jgi:hypothetical protein
MPQGGHQIKYWNIIKTDMAIIRCDCKDWSILVGKYTLWDRNIIFSWRENILSSSNIFGPWGASIAWDYFVYLLLY